MSELTTLNYNNAPIHLRGEMLSLTDMWKAAGEPSGRAPSDWRALASTQSFIEFIADSVIAGKSGNDIFSVSRGGKQPGTWAHWQIGFAYAKYLSPEFHAWCNTAAREKLEGFARHHVSVADLEATVRQVVGGIVKGVVNKALTETVAPVLATLRATHQTGTSAVSDRTATEWLTQYGCVQKGRHGLATKLSNTLRALANKTGTPLLRCARTNTWLFPYDIAVPFMEGQGKAWIRLHNDAVEKGQSALALKGLPKLAFADMTVMRAKAMTLEECEDAIGRSLAVAKRIHDHPEEANIGNCERSLRSAGQTLIYLWGRVQDEKIEQEKALLARMKRLHDGLREDNRRAEMA